MKAVQLVNSSSPVVGIDRVEENEFLIFFMKSFVEQKSGVIDVHFGEGKVSFVSIEHRKRLVKVELHA